ncbi:hypothetical protein BGP77_04790 [Saccharospirillum sp. MSK14-1]|uniref:prepilin-type N-terminal cleavage/methylation domain-containing protein n=1 Tax=Saccharospirillum sp. MSK14-1 TaxID=1897632 RepID=UPI000D370311|nr:prepilin-type N-terminal cleavage/methylation domain-containing protein [Saccharospirillum sp. MSK14-1]PTY36616.1 hypothetical protein BGP77_04790 [Saccharospirillum sp. MSK14-1]
MILRPNRPASPHAGAGFSLIELLVVIIIIGVAAGAVRLAISQPDPLGDLERSAQQLVYRFGQVQDRVLLSGKDRGLVVVDGEVQFLGWKKGDPRQGEPDILWAIDDALPIWQAPDDTELTLFSAGQPTMTLTQAPEDPRDWRPMIILLPSEDYQPRFDLYLRPQGMDNQAIRVHGDGFNRLEVSRVTL